MAQKVIIVRIVLCFLYLQSCRIKANITPPSLFLSGYDDEEGTAVNILMLGLSFMGQPFQSFICLNLQYLNHSSSHANKHSTQESVENITANGGHCTGELVINTTSLCLCNR
jgi:hypothetical protein